VRLELGAFAGNAPHGWLPTIGLARTLLPYYPDLAVRWHDRLTCPVLVDGPETVDEVVEVLVEQLDEMPDGAVLPGVDPEFPDVKARRGEALLVPWTGPDAAMWQQALVGPTGDLHPMISPHAAQTLGRMLRKMVESLRDPDLVRAAIVRLGMSDSYTAGLWILRSDEPQASPGRDWLSVMAVPWMPVVEAVPLDGAPPVTAAVGWRAQVDGSTSGRPVLAWSLWPGEVPAGEIPDLLAAADEDPSPRYRWQRRRLGPKDPPMLRSLSGPLVRGRRRVEADGELVLVPSRVLARVDALVDQTNAATPDSTLPPVTRETQLGALLDSAAVLAQLSDPPRAVIDGPRGPGQPRKYDEDRVASTVRLPRSVAAKLARLAEARPGWSANDVLIGLISAYPEAEVPVE